MKTLDELKKTWGDNVNPVSPSGYDETKLRKIFKSRVNKQARASFGYFWASFVLQIIVYALLGHILIRYWSDTDIALFSVVGILLYIPFTIMLMQKFKTIATTTIPIQAGGTSLQHYVLRYHSLLTSFYTFKKRYEVFLIPLSTAVGVVLIFKLYVPGGVFAHPQGALITFGVTLASCIAAIWNENRKSFEKPLRNLEEIIDEFKDESAIARKP